MNDKRRLSDQMLQIIQAWSKKLTLEEEAQDEGRTLDSALDKLKSDDAYFRGIRDGKVELSRDILEAQDLINHN